jgi:hypothetical protein
MIICGECGQSGGRFRFVREGRYVHTPNCDRAPLHRDDAKDLWGFTTSHFDPNNPVTVRSARHMSSLEKEYGVISRVHNYNEQNW